MGKRVCEGTNNLRSLRTLWNRVSTIGRQLPRKEIQEMKGTAEQKPKRKWGSNMEAKRWRGISLLSPSSKQRRQEKILTAGIRTPEHKWGGKKAESSLTTNWPSAAEPQSKHWIVKKVKSLNRFLHLHKNFAQAAHNLRDSSTKHTKERGWGAGGIYTTIAGATSPFTNAITGTAKFFRLKAN